MELNVNDLSHEIPMGTYWVLITTVSSPFRRACFQKQALIHYFFGGWFTVVGQARSQASGLPGHAKEEVIYIDRHG